MMASAVARLSGTAIQPLCWNCTHLCVGEHGIDELLEGRFELLACRIDPPEAKSAECFQYIEKDGHRHNQVDPVGRRHKVHQPREVSISDLGFTGKKELMRLACERQYSGRACGTRRIAADEARQLGGE